MVMARLQRDDDCVNTVGHPSLACHRNRPCFGMGLARAGMGQSDQDCSRRIQQHTTHRRVRRGGPFVQTCPRNRLSEGGGNHCRPVILICRWPRHALHPTYTVPCQGRSNRQEPFPWGGALAGLFSSIRTLPSARELHRIC